MIETATQAFEQAEAKGQKVYRRKKTSGQCEAGVLNHSSCSGTYFGYASYVIPTRFTCPCQCHAPKATCKRCGMGGLAWAESSRFGRLTWTLYQPVTTVVADTYRMEHRCGVDLEAQQAQEASHLDRAREERAWIRAERFEARQAGDHRRGNALADYSSFLGDLVRPGGLSFEEIVGTNLEGDEDLQARARALYNAAGGQS